MSKRIIHNEISKEHAKADIDALNPDKRWIHSIEEEKDSKTIQQLRLYWKWATIIGDEFGNFKTPQSDWLRTEHLPPVYTEVNNVVHESRKGISQLNVKEMSDYMTRVSYWAASEGIMLPHPEDLQRNQ